MKSMWFSVLFVLIGGNAVADVFDDVERCRFQCSQECVRLGRQLDRAARSIKESCGGHDDDDHGGDILVQIYKSDSCNGELLANVTSQTDCGRFSESGSDAWGIKLDGRCYNITDRSLGSACRQFKAASSYGAVKLFKSDSCSNELIAFVDRFSDCSDHSSSGSDVWGVEIGGTCYNVEDMSARVACNRFAGGFVPGAVKAFKSDSCSGNLIASFHNRTRCDELPASGNDVWAVEIDGTCQNITDTSLQQACIRFGGAK
jgi:hypothetical protein